MSVLTFATVLVMALFIREYAWLTLGYRAGWKAVTVCGFTPFLIGVAAMLFLPFVYGPLFAAITILSLHSIRFYLPIPKPPALGKPLKPARAIDEELEEWRAAILGGTETKPPVATREKTVVKAKPKEKPKPLSLGSEAVRPLKKIKR